MEGVLTPDKFLGVAEEAGLIVPITRWTILRVCKLAAEWRQRLPRDQRVLLSINISASALRDPEFGAYVARALEDTGTPPSMLKFELTEGGLISNPGAMREVLDGLHDHGHRNDARRFRHRLFVAELSATVSLRLLEDRSPVRQSRRLRSTPTRPSPPR